MQRAAIKKQFFLSNFEFTPPAGALSYGKIAITLSTTLADAVAATDLTARVWLDLSSTAALDVVQPTSVTSAETLLAEVRLASALYPCAAPSTTLVPSDLH